MTQPLLTTSAAAAIGQLYQSIDGRQADAAGLASWSSALASGISLASIRSIFASSSETQAKLNLAYKTVYGTPLSAAQLLAAETALKNGSSFSQVTAPWLAAANAQIQSLYLNDLGRAADQVGLASYSTAMLQGTSIATIRATFANSAGAASALQSAYLGNSSAPFTAAQLAADQYFLSIGSTLSAVTSTRMIAAQAAVISAYHDVFNQAPTASQLANASAAILRGTTIASVRSSLVNSPAAVASLNAIYDRTFSVNLSPAQLAAAQSQIAAGSSFTQVSTGWVTNAVNGLYHTILGRAADATGLNAIVQAIANGSTFAQVQQNLATGSEVVSKLQTAYSAAYGSTLSTQQLTSAEGLLIKGQTLAQVEAPWIPAAQALVNNLYLDVLGRAADANGLASYTSGLMSGVSLQTIRDIFSYSSEAAAQLTEAYENTYSQVIQPDHLASFESQLDGGQSLTQVEAAWTGGTVITPSMQITQLYENVLGREPDAGGLASFTNALENGQSLSNIRAMFANSAEAASHLAQAYENAYGQPISQALLAQAQSNLAAGQSVTQVEAPWYTFIQGTTTSPQITLSAVDPFVGSFNGSMTTADFMNLFGNYGTWDTQASTFKISTQFALWGNAQQLQTLYNYLNVHHIALQLEGLMLPMTPGSTAGQGVEGFNGPPGSLGVVAQRIETLGGHLQSIAMDEPLYFGHQYTGTNAPQESIATVAQQVAVNIAAVEKIFPDVKVGDVEPTPGTNDLKTWAADYQAAVGQPLAFFDADVPWTQGPYLGALEQTAGELRQMGVSFGVIINGNGADTTDSEWVNTAEGRLAAIEADSLIRPDQLVVQTWGPNPSHAGPEGTAGSLTNLLGNVAGIATAYANGTLGNEQPAAVSVTSPAALTATVGLSELISGLNLASSTTISGAAQIGVVMLTDSGALSAASAAGVNVTGGGTSSLSLEGSASSIQAELTKISYENQSSGLDHLNITVYEGVHAPVSTDLAITVYSTNTSIGTDIGMASAALSHSATIAH